MLVSFPDTRICLYLLLHEAYIPSSHSEASNNFRFSFFFYIVSEAYAKLHGGVTFQSTQKYPPHPFAENFNYWPLVLFAVKMTDTPAITVA